VLAPVITDIAFNLSALNKFPGVRQRFTVEFDGHAAS
jgi:hypothetical protein